MQEKVNVQCEICNKWGSILFYHETETGHQCNDCNEEIKCEMIFMLAPRQ